jgi:hypothetical protein
MLRLLVAFILVVSLLFGAMVARAGILSDPGFVGGNRQIINTTNALEPDGNSANCLQSSTGNCLGTN